jgi:hypothetical protein
LTVVPDANFHKTNLKPLKSNKVGGWRSTGSQVCPCDGGTASSSPRWGCSVLDATAARSGGSSEVENPCREDALLRKEVFWAVVQFHMKSSLKSQKRALCTLKVDIYSLSKVIIICCRVHPIRCISGCNKSHLGLCGLRFLPALLCSLFLLHLLV